MVKASEIIDLLVKLWLTQGVDIAEAHRTAHATYFRVKALLRAKKVDHGRITELAQRGPERFREAIEAIWSEFEVSDDTDPTEG
jgi:hypothetical protein